MTNFAVGLVGDVRQLMTVRLVTSFLTGLVPLSYAIITSGAPPAKTAQSVAHLQTVTIVASAVGPLIGGILVDRMGVRPGYFVASALCVCGLLLVLLLFHSPERMVPPPTASAERGGLGGAVLALLPLVAVLLLVQSIDRSFQPLIPVDVEELGGARAGGALLCAPISQLRSVWQLPIARALLALAVGGPPR